MLRQIIGRGRFSGLSGAGPIGAEPRVALSRTFSYASVLLQQVPSTKKQTPTLSESATSKAERTLRRFWKKVDVAYHPTNSKLRVRLDGRALKTPSGSVLEIPADRPLLAAVIAKEWAEQEKILRPHSLPLTSLAARAIDGLSKEKDRSAVVDELARYLDTDTIWCVSSPSFSFLTD